MVSCNPDSLRRYLDAQVGSLDAGLKSLDVAISSQCATAVDNLAGYYFKAIQGTEAPTPAVQVCSVKLLC